jgi:hypothetical protein
MSYVHGLQYSKSTRDTFFGARGWKVHSTWGDPPWVSWFVFVPPR